MGSNMKSMDEAKRAQRREKVKYFILLHVIILLYSLSGIASKAAGLQAFLSAKFFIFYGISLLLLFVYALFWQQILKKMPVTTASSNKAVTIVWGMVWGALLFSEMITWKMILGAVIIFVGIYLVVTADE